MDIMTTGTFYVSAVKRHLIVKTPGMNDMAILADCIGLILVSPLDTDRMII